ncbi:hypothetical protein F1D05_09915 [Kribbella qitaiheensis]|uniref:Uncharacterized protein n=1 Tax=Kribbella qitaiheensis TaxID=1544730 RepID=A0A7G6WVY4_9ACTN|nr:hypothetical protein [Kribbella qitaiheensis]QNE18149.1 hypothetical protein F1D05_09915 [Kribbella qitaiheensis]
MAGKPDTLVRRQHTHLLLPSAALDDPQRTLFESALRPAGWTADPDDSSSMSLRWNRRQAALRLQTLGWFPLLVTVGAIGKATSAHRDAAARLTAAVVAGGGKSLTDRELVEYLPQAQARWQRALLERRRTATAERLLEARRCSYCASWSGMSATHCAGCRRRFTTADDAEHEATISRASATLDEAAAILADLARGVTLDRLSGASHG